MQQENLWNHCGNKQNIYIYTYILSHYQTKQIFDSSLPRNSFGNWAGSSETTPWWPTSSQAPWLPWRPQRGSIGPRALWSPPDPGPIGCWPTLACSCLWRYFTHTHAAHVCACFCALQLFISSSRVTIRYYMADVKITSLLDYYCSDFNKCIFWQRMCDRQSYLLLLDEWSETHNKAVASFSRRLKWLTQLDTWG